MNKIIGIVLSVFGLWMFFNVYKVYKSGVAKVRRGVVTREENPTLFYIVLMLQLVLAILFLMFGLFMFTI